MNYLLWALVFSLSTSLFSYTTSLTRVVRVVQGVDSILVAQSVASAPDYVPVSTYSEPYFDMDILKTIVSNYLSDNLGQGFLSGTYNHEIVSLASKNVRFSGVMYRFVSSVRIDFDYSYLGSKAYDTSKTFTIKRGELYDE